MSGSEEGALTVTEIVIKADVFAESKHRGRVDRGGMPYIWHPRAVAAMVDGDVEKAVALLHDTIEDAGASYDEIRETFGEDVANAVLCLTRRDGESYMKYIDRVKGNELARKVKMADLRHNMDLTRLLVITEDDMARVRKYQKAYKKLEKT